LRWSSPLNGAAIAATDADWTWRTFAIIKHHLGGFEDDELRKLLVRAGAIRATAKTGVT
jgi:hypothetical protein